MLLGTAGHVDHGKTTLVSALTGVDCDRLDEEKRRGITIALGFAQWRLPDARVVSVIDVPGHEKLVRTMLVGAGGLDAVLLVVSAAAGVMPQTREHLGACHVLGVRRGVVAVTFADKVDDLDFALELVRAELADTFLADAPLVPVCAPKGEGLDALATEVGALLDAAPPPPIDLPALLPVDRAFTLSGHGTVATGSLVRGRMAVEDAVDLLPGPRGVRVRGLHSHGAAVERIDAGVRVGVNLVVDREVLADAALVAAPGTVHSGRVLDVEIEWLPHLDGPLTRQRGLNFHLATAQALADVRADAPVAPGAHGTARIRLDRSLPLPAGARFVLRGQPTHRHGAVVGGGRILDPRPPRRRAAEIRARLAGASPEGALEILLAEAGSGGLDPREVPRRLPLPTRSDEGRLFSEAAVEESVADLIAAVRAWQRKRPHDPGMSLPEPNALQARARDRALADGRLKRSQGALHTPDHQAGLDDETRALSKKLMRAIGKAGLSGPTERELLDRFPAPDAVLADVLRYLEKQGRVGRSDGFCFPGRELESLADRAAAAVLAQGELSVGWLKETAGVTRKHAIPLFLWLDAAGVTMRRGNVRIPGPKARERVDA